jgi:hypothetical protein
MSDRYVPETMSFSEGLLGPKGNVGYFMEADYQAAVAKVTALLETHNILKVEMGLDGDWGCNSQTIWTPTEGFQEYYTHSYSNWAPTIILVFFRGGRVKHYPVWKRGEDS